MKRFFAPICMLTIAIAANASLASLAVAQAPTEAEPAKAVPTKAEPTKAALPKAAKATPSVRPLSVTVGLVSTNEIEGTLTDTTQLQMQTSFGTASIPLSEVAGVRFASANDATTTVVMLNGDSITGATDVKLITVETEWGTASINGPSIASIMFVPGLKWNPQSGLNGKRWSLSDEKTTPPPATTTPTRSQSQSTRSTSSNGTRTNPQSFPSQSFNNNGQFFQNR
ncbi:hypothetical protein SAMN06265222_113132 [Neorhodopirellula lusitana]|uniref:Uncharacterized protein n=1 Tax=Neorhodopirellula lusitana TaxID=445327 RepID=A0ABY1QHK0_9BACT|nr:hypothetical protein [Neorhodopirellula lusitana]SMP70808.1 hypothetical protein SAMN06265222_113132 [Neorhodopirellula lusitana]